jgi:N-acetyl-alpha-D-muramate 1-phosphate uridylyltransferase
MSLPVAILAGGMATRLGAVTERMPKALVDIAGRPFAEHQIEVLRAHGVTDIVFLIRHFGEMIESTLGDGSRFHVRLRYVFDGDRPLSTGGAIRHALDRLADAFFVLYGDSYLECDYAAIERAFAASGQPALMTVCRNDDRWDRSNVVFENGRIVRYDKRTQTPEMRHIDYGLGVFRRAVFDRYPRDEAFDLADVYGSLIDRGELAGFDVPGRFYEIGSAEGLAETRAHLAHGAGRARGRAQR